jgi:hypothetical protein
LSIAALVLVKMSSNFNCSYMAMSSLTYIQWTIEEISIFCNSSHLEWRTGLSDTILKGTHPGTIPARFGFIWFSGSRGEDLNVIFYQNMPQNVPKFELCKHNDELFSIYYCIFCEL